jgi:Uma2 family endonuclease
MYSEEKPITIADLISEPQPGITVVLRKDYSKANPSPEEIRLVAEVADSSLEKDQTVKVILYAEANIAEYWIINLPKRRVEVHLYPLPEERTYRSVNIYEEAESFESPFAGTVLVKELLPEG